MLDKLDKFHKSRAGYGMFALSLAGLAYAMASLAIDRGSWWWYVLALTFIMGFLQNLWHLMRPPQPAKPKRARQP